MAFDPVLATAAANALGSAVGGAAGGAAGPSSADAIFSTNLQFDNSGWNVAFGSSRVDSKSDKTAEQSSDGRTAGSSSNGQIMQFALLAVGGIVAIKAIKAFSK